MLRGASRGFSKQNPGGYRLIPCKTLGEWDRFYSTGKPGANNPRRDSLYIQSVLWKGMYSGARSIDFQYYPWQTEYRFDQIYQLKESK